MRRLFFVTLIFVLTLLSAWSLQVKTVSAVYVGRGQAICQQGGWKSIRERCGPGECRLLQDWQSWQDYLKVDADQLNILGIKMTADELKSLIRTIILIATSLLAVILIGVILYGGFLWITAGDSEEKLQKAKKVMKSGFIGIVLAFGFIIMLGIMAAFFGVNITDFSFLDEILGT